MSAIVCESPGIYVVPVKKNCEVRMLNALPGYFGAYSAIAGALNSGDASHFAVTVTQNSTCCMYAAREFESIEDLRSSANFKAYRLATWEYLFAHGPVDGNGLFAPGTEIRNPVGLHFPCIRNGNEFCLVPLRDALRMSALLVE